MLPKSDKANGIEDSAFIQGALSSLMKGCAEFYIKVEGTSTLPYASQIQEMKPGAGGLLLKLVRPLPHELMSGAIFRAVFPVDEQRYECLITFQGRQGYLQYVFDYPVILSYADRRRAKRYPFRPRERAYVVGQDGGIPGMGIAGPLINISMGGFSLRLDRVIKLDDNMRVPPRLAVIERGKYFGRIRIQDLPKASNLECRASVAHYTNKNGEILLGFTFANLSEDMERLLNDCFVFRDKVLKGGGIPSRSEAPSGGPRASKGKALEEEAAIDEMLDEPLLRMQRRSSRMILAMPQGPERQATVERLASIGYLRLELCTALEDVVSLAKAMPQSPVRVLVLDMSLSPSKGDAMSDLKHIEAMAEDIGSPPILALCETVDSDLMLSLGERTRVLLRLNSSSGGGDKEDGQEGDAQDEDVWTATLDALAGFRP